MDWLRLWHDMPNDPKWRTIERLSGEHITLVLSIYLHLLVDASRNVTRGHVSVTTEDLASALNVTDKQISAVLTAMEGRVLHDGALMGWEKRQPKREDSGNEFTGAKSATQRKAEERERKRLAKLDAEKPTNVTHGHEQSRNVTTEEIRLDTEKSITKEVTHTSAESRKSVCVLNSGAVCIAMKARGIGDVSPGNQDLVMLLEAGATVAEFEDAADNAVSKAKGFKYALGVVKNSRIAANAASQLVHKGAMPQPQPTETAYQRSIRENAEQLAPGVARRAPATAANAAHTIDLEPNYVAIR